jgi:ribosomal protein L34E
LLDLRLSRAIVELTQIDFAGIKGDRSRLHPQQTHNSKPKQLKCPKRGAQLQGVAQYQCATSKEMKETTKKPPRAKCATQEERDKACKVASTGKRCATPKLY